MVWIIGRNGVSGVGFSPGVALPAKVAARIEAGQEMSEAVAAEYDTDTVDDRDSSIVLSHGKLPVVDFYRIAVEMAVADYRNNMSSD